jgi:hypothetical protein
MEVNKPMAADIRVETDQRKDLPLRLVVLVVLAQAVTRRPGEQLVSVPVLQAQAVTQQLVDKPVSVLVLQAQAVTQQMGDKLVTTRRWYRFLFQLESASLIFVGSAATDGVTQAQTPTAANSLGLDIE